MERRDTQREPGESLTETATKLDGGPDMRRKENRDDPSKVAAARGDDQGQEVYIGRIDDDQSAPGGQGASSPDHTRRDGEPDHRFKENR